MSDINNCFTSIGLKHARKASRDLKVKIPKLSTWKDTGRNNPWFEVWADAEIVWSGTAYNAAEAKTNAIYKLIEKAGHEIIAIEVE